MFVLILSLERDDVVSGTQRKRKEGREKKRLEEERTRDATKFLDDGGLKIRQPSLSSSSQPLLPPLVLTHTRSLFLPPPSSPNQINKQAPRLAPERTEQRRRRRLPGRLRVDSDARAPGRRRSRRRRRRRRRCRRRRQQEQRGSRCCPRSSSSSSNLPPARRRR